METQLFQKPDRYFPPVPPKPTMKVSYLKKKFADDKRVLKSFCPDYALRFSNPMILAASSSPSSSSDSIECHHLPQARLRKVQPPVPEKSMRIKSSNTIRSKISRHYAENGDFSDYRSKSICADQDEKTKSKQRRHGKLFRERNLERSSLLVASTGRLAAVDGFTTEDKDLFSNARSLEYEESYAINSKSLLEVSNVCDIRIEACANENNETATRNSSDVEENIIKKVSMKRSSKNTDFHSDNLCATASQRTSVSTDLCPSGTEENTLIKRNKLGSVSFTSFDNLRSSYVREVNLKKQIFQRLRQRESGIKKFDEDPNDTSNTCCDNNGFLSDPECQSDRRSIELNASLPRIRNEKPAGSSRHIQEMGKLHKIALELLATEENYVKRLHLIDQVFHFEILVTNRKLNMFPKEVLLEIFSNVKSIYQFHHDFLLQQLRKRLIEWDKIPKIGDIMRTFAPFLKLYVEYVQNFDNAIGVINFWMTKSSKFNNLMEKLQKRPECQQMSLQHHMLEPIQRVPRYLVLLREYIKHLPEDSSDRDDSIAALDLVERAVSHSNESLRTFEKFQKLLTINERLDNAINVVSPTRRFIKEGKLKFVSPKDGSQTDRYLYLFNDLLLICQAMPLKLGGKSQFKLKMAFKTAELELKEDSHNLMAPGSFYLKSKENWIELLSCNHQLKEDWLNAISGCIRPFAHRSQVHFQELSCEELGKRAPFLTKYQEASMCMICASGFNIFSRKRHCNACGIVICSKCSTKKIFLEFANEARRVCSSCFCNLQNQMTQAESLTSHSVKKCQSSLKVKATDSHVICGYLRMCRDNRNWQNFYVTVHNDFVLYAFKAHKDVQAFSSLPLPGYCIDHCSSETKVFTISHKNQHIKNYFMTDDENNRELWVRVLKFIVRAELPDDFSSCLSTICPQ